MKHALAFLVAAVLAGCGSSLTPTATTARGGDDALVALRRSTVPSGQIRHVVIIIQENRSVDNLFNGLRGADTVHAGKNSLGETVRLRPVTLTGNYDISHEHGAFLVEHANGRLDGFNNVHSSCKLGKQCPKAEVRAYAYVPRAGIAPYFDLAEEYAFADHVFQTNEGPSFPAHQYLLSGTSTIANGSPLRAASNAFAPLGGFTGGCDSPAGSIVRLIDQFGNEDQAMYPCFDRLALSDLVDAKGLTWRYYVGNVLPGLWNAPDAIAHIRRNSAYYLAHVVAPPETIFTDIAQNRLANVVWLTPKSAFSDHAGTNNGTGPSWVASVVNAIGKSGYWNDTAIFVTWDDWGGWYDHVPPPQYNSYELGFRVPLIVISPYAKRGYVSHRQHEFGSILKFTEEAFGLGSMHTTDVRADDLSDCFNFGQLPTRFRFVASPRDARYFLRSSFSSENPDDD